MDCFPKLAVSLKLIWTTLIPLIASNPMFRNELPVRNNLNSFSELNKYSASGSNVQTSPDVPPLYYVPVAYYSSHPVHYGIPTVVSHNSGVNTYHNLANNNQQQQQNFMKDYASVPQSQQLGQLTDKSTNGILMQRQQGQLHQYPQMFDQRHYYGTPAGYQQQQYGMGMDLSPYAQNGMYNVPAINMQPNQYMLPRGMLSQSYYGYDSGEADDDSSHETNNGSPVKVGDVALNFGFSGGISGGNSSSDATTTAKPPGFDWAAVLGGVMGGIGSIVQASAQKEMMQSMQRTMLLTHLMDM